MVGAEFRACNHHPSPMTRCCLNPHAPCKAGITSTHGPRYVLTLQQLPELPDDVLEIPRMDVEFRDVEF